jgi:hypothetical protein
MLIIFLRLLLLTKGHNIVDGKTILTLKKNTAAINPVCA